LKQIVVEGWSNSSLPSATVLLQVVQVLKKCAKEAVKDRNGREFIALIHCR